MWVVHDRWCECCVAVGDCPFRPFRVIIIIINIVVIDRGDIPVVVPTAVAITIYVQHQHEAKEDHGQHPDQPFQPHVDHGEGDVDTLF